jgi:HK97 family phage portal protein
LNHPLVGLSPIYACGLAAVLGLKIQQNSANLFQNGASPGGLLMVPTAITQEQSDRLKANFKAGVGGNNYGDLVVLTNGLDYKPIAQTAVDSQLIDQWKATSEAVCAAFHVPGHMVGVGPAPTVGTNVESLAIQYFAQALQEPAKCIEDHLDYALGLTEKIDGRQLGVGFDHDDLFWMDTATMVENEAKKVGAGIASPNEARKKFDAKPVEGGDTPYLQEQNWPLRLLSARELPTRPPTAPEPIEEPDEDEEELSDEAVENGLRDLLRKELDVAA